MTRELEHLPCELRFFSLENRALLVAFEGSL